MKYSIVIPTYNHCDDLLKPCIESIYRNTDLSNVEIIVVANGCTDNTREYVESLPNNVRLIWAEKALGYTKATNLGILASQAEYVLLLNNDVQILDYGKHTWLSELTKPFINNPKMALTGTLKLRDPDINQDFIVFSCALVKREIFEKIGMLDEVFSPGYGEDIDFCMRIIENNYQWKCVDETKQEKGMHVGTFPIWHKGTQTFGSIPEYGNIIVKKNASILRERYVHKKTNTKYIYTNTIKYSIIIPTYNHCDDLLKPCVDTIFKYTNMAEVELIISANGCIDRTQNYLAELRSKFDELGFHDNFKIVWNDPALGYAKACNEAIKVATTDKIILLNNDILLLGQDRSAWIKLLDAPFNTNPKAGITCVIKGPSEPAGHDFAVFFCVMIHRKVFDKIGLLNEEYGVGGGEDTEFCIEAERAGFEVCLALEHHWSQQAGMYTGGFPIYHKGEGTMHDPTLVPNHSTIFVQNSLILARRYNREWYLKKISNNYERSVFLPGDQVLPCENARYTWASKNILGTKVFELGCSNGYGTQYMPSNIEYIGCDHDPLIIWCAKTEGWNNNPTFITADISTYDLDYYDTIIAFEVLEHLDNTFEIIEKLKKHCTRLLISVPHMEPPGFWGKHHKIHMLNETYFPGFEFKYINSHGHISNTLEPTSNINKYNLLLMSWTKSD